jgi:hypothetical protein
MRLYHCDMWFEISFTKFPEGEGVRVRLRVWTMFTLTHPPTPTHSKKLTSIQEEEKSLDCSIQSLLETASFETQLCFYLLASQIISFLMTNVFTLKL